MLAFTDHGGSGPELVLMHGLGMDRRSLRVLAESLPGWRVVTVDLAGHGESPTADWSFEAAVADLAAVVRSCGLSEPYVGGHSLGGMVGLRYALAGHPVVGVVNIDGWGPGVAGRFPDEDPAEVRAWLARVADGRVPAGLLGWLTGRRRVAREGTTAAVLRALAGADVVQWHADAPCPSLAVNATATSGRATRWLMGRQATRFEQAHRRGLTRDLRALAERRADVHVFEIDATHMLVRSHAIELAAEISSFHGASYAPSAG